MVSKTFLVKHQKIFADVITIAELNKVCYGKQSAVDAVGLLLYRRYANSNIVEISTVKTC